jgi:hypothetical protein
MSYLRDDEDGGQTLVIDGTCAVEGCNKPLARGRLFDWQCEDHKRKMGESWLAKELRKMEAGRRSNSPTRQNRQLSLGEWNERSKQARTGVVRETGTLGEVSGQEGTRQEVGAQGKPLPPRRSD